MFHPPTTASPPIIQGRPQSLSRTHLRVERQYRMAQAAAAKTRSTCWRCSFCCGSPRSWPDTTCGLPGAQSTEWRLTHNGTRGDPAAACHKQSSAEETHNPDPQIEAVLQLKHSCGDEITCDGRTECRQHTREQSQRCELSENRL